MSVNGVSKHKWSDRDRERERNDEGLRIEMRARAGKRSEIEI